MEEKTYIK